MQYESKLEKLHSTLLHIIHLAFLSLLMFVDSKRKDTSRNVQTSCYMYPSYSSRSEFKSATFNTTGSRSEKSLKIISYTGEPYSYA